MGPESLGPRGRCRGPRTRQLGFVGRKPVRTSRAPVHVVLSKTLGRLVGRRDRRRTWKSAAGRSGHPVHDECARSPGRVVGVRGAPLMYGKRIPKHKNRFIFRPVYACTGSGQPHSNFINSATFGRHQLDCDPVPGRCGRPWPEANTLNRVGAPGESRPAETRIKTVRARRRSAACDPRRFSFGRASEFIACVV